VTGVFTFHEGDTPILISIPHDGRQLAAGQAARMTDAGCALPDTDWHVRRLYEFATETGASVISAIYSRYVVDLNRPADDATLYDGQVATGICPTKSFAGQDIYVRGELVTAAEQAARIDRYWRPYHEKIAGTLDRLRANFGYALLWDAHSIAGEVPRLFDGVLPDLNVGTDDGRSCAAPIAARIMKTIESSGYSSVLNGRFRGGYITRHYGRPADGVHALQLEIAQRNYMDEQSLEYRQDAANDLSKTIRRLLQVFADAAAVHG
jgi:N-formylglutamate amidohydrolase